jgi:hypothetical protein
MISLTFEAISDTKFLANTSLIFSLRQRIIYLKTPGLISALGGSLGLFSGIAIIMIFEIFELAWDLFYNIWIFATLGKVPKITEDRREMQLRASS